MSKHTPEPWVLFEVGDRFKHQCPASSEKGSILTIATEDDVQFGAVYSDEDARRIVACVNACAGIPTEILELDEKSALACREHVQKLKSERDELIKALDSVADELGIVWMRQEFELANEVLRRIKGGAA